MRSVENAECGKRGVWKMRSVESAECRKFQFQFSIFNFPFQFQFSISISREMRKNSVLTIKNKQTTR